MNDPFDIIDNIMETVLVVMLAFALFPVLIMLWLLGIPFSYKDLS